MAEPTWLQEARKLEGLTEIVGSEHEPRVVEFFAEAGHGWVKDDETAWCAAFANAMLARAGWQGTGKLTARSFLDWGAAVQEKDVRPGDLAILPRGNSSWQGHVTFVVSTTDKTFQGLGGNQKNAVRVDTYSKQKVLGYRRPNIRLPERTDAGTLREGMFNSPRVKTMQVQLKERNYPVGVPDGDFGNVTRDAVLAWKADNGRPLSPEMSPSDLDLLESSGPRPLSEARQSAKVTEVKAVDKSVKNDDSAVKVAVGTAVAVGCPAAADGLFDLENLKEVSQQVGQAKGIVEQVVSGAKTLGIDVTAFVSSHSTLLLICGLIAAGFFVWRSMQAKVADHRNGRTL